MTIEMIYQIEPQLKVLANEVLREKSLSDFYAKFDAYTKLKNKAHDLIGWCAQDPRLRNSGAWDCYFDYVLDELEV